MPAPLWRITWDLNNHIHPFKALHSMHLIWGWNSMLPTGPRPTGSARCCVKSAPKRGHEKETSETQWHRGKHGREKKKRDAPQSNGPRTSPQRLALPPTNACNGVQRGLPRSARGSLSIDLVSCRCQLRPMAGLHRSRHAQNMNRKWKQASSAKVFQGDVQIVTRSDCSLDVLLLEPRHHRSQQAATTHPISRDACSPQNEPRKGNEGKIRESETAGRKRARSIGTRVQLPLILWTVLVSLWRGQASLWLAVQKGWMKE